MIGGDTWWPYRTIPGSMEDLHVAVHRHVYVSGDDALVLWCIAWLRTKGLKG